MNKIVILIVIIVLLIICFIVFKINEKSAYRAETNPTDLQLETFYETLLNSVSNNYINYMANQKFSGITTLINQKSLKSNSKCNYLRTDDGAYRLYLDKPTGPIRQFGIDTYYAGLNIRNYNDHSSSINIKTLDKASSINYSELVVENNGVTFKDSTGTPIFNFFNFSPTPYSINLELKLYNGTNVGSTTPVLYIQAASLTTTWDNRFGTKNLILWEPVDNRSLLVSGGDNNLSFNENSQLTGSNKLYKYDSKLDYIRINNSNIRHVNGTVLYEATSLSTYTGEFSNYILRITGKGEVQFLSTFNTNFIDTLRSSSIPSGVNSPYFLEINNDNVLQLRDVLGNRGLLDDVPRSSLTEGQYIWANGNRLYSINRSYSFHLERGIGANAKNIYMIVTKDPMESPEIVWRSKEFKMNTSTSPVRLRIQQNNWGGLSLEETDSGGKQIWLADTKENTHSLEIDNEGYLRIYNSSRGIEWPTKSIPQGTYTNGSVTDITINFLSISNTNDYIKTRLVFWKCSNGTWSKGLQATGGFAASVTLKRGESVIFGFNTDDFPGDLSDNLIYYNDSDTSNTVDLWLYNDINASHTTLEPYGRDNKYYFTTLNDGGKYRYARLDNGTENLTPIELNKSDNSGFYPFRYTIDISNPSYIIPIGGYYNTMNFCNEIIYDKAIELNIILYAWHGNNPANNTSAARFLRPGYIPKQMPSQSAYANGFWTPYTVVVKNPDDKGVISTETITNSWSNGGNNDNVTSYYSWNGVSNDDRNRFDHIRLYAYKVINHKVDLQRFNDSKQLTAPVTADTNGTIIWDNIQCYTPYPTFSGLYLNYGWWPQQINNGTFGFGDGFRPPITTDYQAWSYNSTTKKYTYSKRHFFDNYPDIATFLLAQGNYNNIFNILFYS